MRRMWIIPMDGLITEGSLSGFSAESGIHSTTYFLTWKFSGYLASAGMAR